MKLNVNTHTQAAHSPWLHIELLLNPLKGEPGAQQPTLNILRGAAHTRE